MRLLALKAGAALRACQDAFLKGRPRTALPMLQILYTVPNKNARFYTHIVLDFTFCDPL